MKNEKKISIKDYTTGLGNVNITVLHNGKVRRKINAHNAGTVNMCIYLRNALVGDYVIADRPGIIVPCVTGEGGSLVDYSNGKGTPLFNDFPTKSKENDDLESNSSAGTLSFLIPSNFLPTSPLKINGFRLYSKESKKLFAEVDLRDIDGEDISPEITFGENLRVDWTLIVKLVEKSGG